MNAIVKAADIAGTFEDMQRVAKMLAMTGYFAAKGDSAIAIAQIATQILAGREMGYGPFASVNGIHIINGKPAQSANLMASAVKNSPRYDYRVREITDQVCRIEFFEYVDGKRESLGVSEFTADQARKAGVKNMDKFARNMLFARAMSNGVRWYCPDVFAGNTVYVPEELGAEVDGEGNVIDVTPTQATGGNGTPETSPTLPGSNSVRRRVEMQQAQPTAHVDTAPAVNPDGVDNAETLFETQTPTDDELEILGAWRNAEDAYAWAVQSGGCANEFEARNSMKNLINDEFGGRFTKANAGQVYLAYLRKQQRKAAEHKGAA